MIAVRELRDWLNSLDPGDVIGVDDGGLTLCVVGTSAYIEVGGLPEPESCDDCGEVIACGRCGDEHPENHDCPIGGAA